MNNTQTSNTGENKYRAGENKYRVILFVFIGLAAFSSAMKELNQLQAFTLEASNLIADWSSVIVPTASARTRPAVETCMLNSVPQGTSRSDEFRWNGNVAQGAAIEIRGINGDIAAEPATGNEVEVVALKRSRRSDVNSVQVRVVPHAGGVTICALYPTDDGTLTTCEPGGGTGDRPRSSSATIKSDVRVDFTVRVPARVAFIGRTINGEIGATSLASNIVTKTVNGSIKISTSGYAEATTVNGEISARMGDASWPKSVSFTTVNGGITLDLPANLSTEVELQTLNGTIFSGFPLNVMNATNRKHVKGTIGAGGRELLLKTLNGSISVRIAS